MVAGILSTFSLLIRFPPDEERVGLSDILPGGTVAIPYLVLQCYPGSVCRVLEGLVFLGKVVGGG